MRPIILMDMDGPIAAWNKRFWEQVAVLGVDCDADLQTQTHRYATDHVIDKAERKVLRRITEQRGWYLNLEPVPGALDGLSELAELADVYICTKPAIDNPYCRDEKAAWVQEHLGRDWLRRLIITSDKSLIRGDVLVDDAPKPEWITNPETLWRPIIYPEAFNADQFEAFARWTWADGAERLIALTNGYDR